MTNTTKTQHVEQCYAQTNTYSVNKTWTLLQTTGGRDETNRNAHHNTNRPSFDLVTLPSNDNDVNGLRHCHLVPMIDIHVHYKVIWNVNDDIRLYYSWRGGDNKWL